MIPTFKKVPVLVFGLILASAMPSFADDQALPNVEVETLLQTETDIIGQPIHYPQGKPRITAAYVVFEPGASTGWHEHPVPLFARVMDGEITVDYGSKGKRVYHPGDVLVEAMDWPHNGTNTGNLKTRILVVYSGDETTPTAIPAGGAK